MDFQKSQLMRTVRVLRKKDNPEPPDLPQRTQLKKTLNRIRGNK